MSRRVVQASFAIFAFSSTFFLFTVYCETCIQYRSSICIHIYIYTYIHISYIYIHFIHTYCTLRECRINFWACFVSCLSAVGYRVLFWKVTILFFFFFVLLSSPSFSFVSIFCIHVSIGTVWISIFLIFSFPFESVVCSRSGFCRSDTYFCADHAASWVTIRFWNFLS